MTKLTVKPENIAHLVQLVRGEKVMLDSDLATLYGVETGALNRAVKRNATRFPADFMFQITANEWKGLRYQSGISNSGDVSASRNAKGPMPAPSSTRGGARYRPYVFTEHGVAMLSSVLRSPRAIEVNIAIMRTFVQLRRLMDSNRELARRIDALEQRYDEQFSTVFDAIKRLITEDEALKAKPKRGIGFLD